MNNAPTWLLVAESLLYVVILGFVIFVYVVMVTKFRQSRKKLEALQKLGQEDSNEMQKPKFQRTFLTISRTVKIQTIPDIQNKDVYLVGYKTSVDEFKEEKMNKPKKRRSSSVVKRFSNLVSHARAATYVLVIVSVYLATWTPFFAYCLYKSLTRVYLDNSVDVELRLNITVLRSCISDALQNQSCIIQTNNITSLREYTKLILQSLEMKVSSNILGNYIPMLNSLANPVLYALWYPDFRNYTLLIPKWISSTFKKTGKLADYFTLKMSRNQF